MCDIAVIEWSKNHITKAEIEGKRVLDVGSYNVNGTLRDAIMPLKPIEYIGIDMQAGPCVNIVCNTDDMLAKFGENSFDVIVSSSALEHIKNCRLAISNMKRICKPEGRIIIDVPSVFHYHKYPEDYWRYSKEDMEYIFSDCVIELIDFIVFDNSRKLICVKVRKPVDFVEKDISKYEIYNINEGKAIGAI